MSIPVSERLTTLSPSASVLSILDDHQPIYGYHRLQDSSGLEISFIDNFDGTGAGLNYPFGRGTLSPFDTWGPHKRFVKNGFVFASNPAYDSVGDLAFQRLYYKHGKDASQGSIDSQDQDRPIYVFSDFLENGYFYKKKQNGEPFSFTILGTTYSDSEFGFSSDADTAFIAPDFNGDGVVSTADQIEFLTATGGVGGVHSDSDVFGVASANFNPYSKKSSFYEVLTQFNSYPAITLPGVQEVVSFPGDFSLLLYDAKRDSSFQITVTHLAEVISQISGIISSGVSSGGTVNITAPLLTTSQLENFFSIQNSADLNADGSVSTADLLQFLTAFGDVGIPPVPTLEVNTAVSYHGGALDSTVAVDLISLDPPYYPASSQPDITYSSQTFQSSYGQILFIGAPPSGILSNPEDNGVLGQISAVDAEAYSVLELAWRLHTYVSNEESLMGAHTSPATGIYPLTQLEMPPINKFCFRGDVFDDMLEVQAVSYGSYVFEDMFASGDIFIQSAPLFTYGGFSLVDFANIPFGESPPSFPYWAEVANEQRRRFGVISDRGTTTQSLLNANARFQVTVNGYVCSSDSNSAIVPIFLRLSGLSSQLANQDADVLVYSDCVYVLGHVDMSVDTTYDVESDEKYKTFEFTRDLDDYECPFDPVFASETANRMPSVVNAGADVHFALFSTQIADIAKSVFITGVEFNYKGSKNATLS